ncbi:MAG: Gfo/Idh/MocA family oxidoreductase [Armatimonadetes bacterium]|nr:Gfo/Idh/MocA family oxidoreductase [Armatimonadota bacterium]
MTDLQLTPADYRPAPPPDATLRIGILGCGNIARNAHLRAYRDFGYRVTAACDLNPDSLRAALDGFGIPWGTVDLAEFLARNDYDILDLAVHGHQRLAVVEQIVAARPPGLRGILSQKPLAMRYADAERMVALCEQAGIVFMVNQQARWAPSHRAVKLLLERGVLGHVYCITHFHRQSQDVAGSWFTALENANIVDHGVHYLDLIRHFAGATPLRVKAVATWVPGQHAVSPMCHCIACEFEPSLEIMAVSYFNNIVRTPELYGYDWYLDGTAGSLKMGYNEVVVTQADSPLEKVVYRIQGSWFPEAFGGSMGELMRAVQAGREPLTNGRDNLK